MDTFLVSVGLYKSGAVTLYEVLDFVEHGSDHSPVYLRLKVQPTWINRPNLPKRRILKRSGIELLRRRLGINSSTRIKTVYKIVSAFSHLEWSKANTRHDMDVLWEQWLKSYNTLIDDLIGTRWARVSSWGREFNMDVRKLCLKASIARAWFVEAKSFGPDVTGFYENWERSRKAFIESWERANKDWYVESVTRAIDNGDVAVWRLLSDKWKKTSRSMSNAKGSILTDPTLIEAELLRYHYRSWEENSSVPPGCKMYSWIKEFIFA